MNKIPTLILLLLVLIKDTNYLIYKSTYNTHFINIFSDGFYIIINIDPSYSSHSKIKNIFKNSLFLKKFLNILFLTPLVSMFLIIFKYNLASVLLYQTSKLIHILILVS